MSLFNLSLSLPPAPFILHQPNISNSYPILVSSPHSGAHYTQDLLSLCRLPLSELRKSEDCYVHQLFNQTTKAGGSLLRTDLPRIFCDLNREAWELDPDMYKDPLPSWCNSQTAQVKRGLGTIHKIGSNRKAIYKYYLSFKKIQQRIQTYWFPYHQKIQDFIYYSTQSHQGCIILDVHSMPSPNKYTPYYADIVLGDGFSQTCSPLLINNSQQFFENQGLKTLKNMPYAGGYITRHYGNPRKNIHTMQIEINKSLYMNEETLETHSGFSPLITIINRYLQWLSTQIHTILGRC
ncbi:N-formylglutamate amidohydrolase [Commensalibacter oyaizuii]|uniref:N-formylglutamate amidohydrolase n=1 Tax=Commensalibacter oyaizuii TaxID=3043873 RepID=A0ABT6PZS1_9PROT|nr:N-formylglutamate amidohydrolase [Commensalibacter sp. TBRC 16381]MDI2090353.1 N-formylglutamate amidohydrolase [Commensalibacter sp. TBRC 16381]